MKIMFICTENTCRSAMAHALLEEKTKESGRDIKVYSCGIYAEDGDEPTYTGIEVMKEYDIDLKGHRATNIRNSKIEEMDFIFCMTMSHKYNVLQMYPQLKEKVFLLKEYVSYGEDPQDKEILDPWGYDIETYRSCANEINMCIDRLLEKI